MIQDIMDFLSQADPEVGASIQKEFDREQHNIELIASENIVSKAVLLAMGTCLTNKYAEGYPGKRYYGGCYAVDVTEELARQRACQLFDCAHANVQPHSGANANLAAFFSLLQPFVFHSFPIIKNFRAFDKYQSSPAASLNHSLFSNAPPNVPALTNASTPASFWQSVLQFARFP